eukprot:jgi/Mesen1/3769/ME000205S03032
MGADSRVFCRAPPGPPARARPPLLLLVVVRASACRPSATVSGGGKSSNLAAVLGSVFGAMLVVAIVAAAIIVFLLRKLKRQKDEMSRPFYKVLKLDLHGVHWGMGREQSTNILIDDKFRARVADFGLSKLAPDGDEEGGSSVDTKVKGTLGYLDPEYFLTDRLTEKSDVYSFGVVIMELVSGRRPIQENEHIIRHINMQVQLSGLKDVVDPTLGKSYLHEHAARMVDLALKCCHENPKKRPTMQDVLLELESIRGMLAHTSSAFDDESGGDNKSSLGYLEYHHAGTRGLNPYSSSSIISDSSHSSSHPTSAEQVNYVSPRQVGEHLIDISGSFQLSLVTPK